MRKTAANVAFWRGLGLGFPEIPALRVSEWAHDYRVLSGEATARSGKWSKEDIPYQNEPMDSAADPTVTETVLMWAAQLGKSEVENNVLGFYAHAEPSPQLMVQPTIEMAEAYSKERIAPMIRDTPVLRAIIRDPRSRDSGNTLLSKVYPGGNLALVGANAPSGLAGRPRRVILLDEIDRYPDSAGSEGDPCDLADKRAESFPNAIKFKTSTPTIKGLSRIEKLIEGSDFRKWHVCCPRCQFEQVLAWAQIKWPEGTPEEAFLECANEKCLGQLSDAEREGMVRAGQWKPTREFRGIRGYWLNGINSLFGAQKGFRNKLHQFAAQFLKARDGGAESVKVWTNTFLAETYEEAGEAIDPLTLGNNVESYNPVEVLPRAAMVLTAGADVQGDRIEIGIDAWGADEECWSVLYKVVFGDPRKQEVWADLDKVIGMEFAHPTGRKLTIERTLIDCGYAMDRVLAFTGARAMRGVFACRGVNRVGMQVPPLLPPRPSRNNKSRIPFWPVGVTAAKTAIYSRLLMVPGGARTIHFPEHERKDGSVETFGFDESYFKQLTAEKMRTRYSHGQPYKIFEKDNNSVRNEAIDIRVYSFAALHSLMPIRWHKVKETFDDYEREHPAEATGIEPGEADAPADESRAADPVEPREVAAAKEKPALAPVAQRPRPAFVPRPRRPRGFARGW